MPAPPVVAVAGATGWLGHHCVHELTQRGFKVVALARPTADTTGLPASTVVARCNALDPPSLTAALSAHAPIAGLISCLGLRGHPPDRDVFALLAGGTAALASAAHAAGARRFVTVAGGIHRSREGEPVETMIHNKAREGGLRIARQAAAGGGMTITAVDASVFFKDAATLFDMVASAADWEKKTSSLTLVDGAWTVLCNPISGRDLAARLVGVVVSTSPPPPRVTAGGPDTLTFAQVVDTAGDSLGVTVKHATMPRWVARLARAAAGAAAAVGVARARGLHRFLTFLWVVATDESPGGLVGDADGARDHVADFFRERAVETRREARG